jgi:NodT family efflux transporter outer membrane factor (OMF) lipoprotein
VTSLALLSLALFSGCSATLENAPEPPTSDLGVPDFLTTDADRSEGNPASAAVSPESSTRIRTDRWWQHFDDQALDALIEEMLDNNPALTISARNVDAALARARIKGADLQPQVGLGLNNSRSKVNFIGLPIPGAEGRVLSSTSSNAGLSLNASWEVDLWGRLSAQKAGSYAELAATEADHEAAILSLSGQTARTYFQLVESRQQIDLSRSTVDSRKRAQQRVEARYRGGLAPSLEVRLARTQTANIEAQLANQEQLLDFLTRQLEILLGRYPDRELASGNTLPAMPAPLSDPLPASLIARRPDLRATERRAFASSAQLAAAERARYPSLSLTGSSGTTSDSLSDLLNGDFSVWSLAANLLQPIFQGGRLRAGVDLAEAGLDIATAQWLQTSLQAFLEVETALEAEGFLDRQVNALAEAADQSRAAERLALDRYQNGLADYLSVLESQRASFQAQSLLLTARRQRLESRIDLILALGGSTEPGDDPLAPAPSQAD